MAIVKMSRFNLIFFHEQRESLLKKLQHFKYVHLEQLKETELREQFNLQAVTVEENIKAVDEQIRQTTFIIDQLQPFDFREKGLMQIKDGMPSLDLETLESKAESIQLEKIYEQVREVIDDKERINREITYINEQIVELDKWTQLNFPLRDLNQFHRSTVHLGVISKALFERFKIKLDEHDLVYYDIINEESQDLYVLLIAHKEKQQTINELMLKYGFNEVSLRFEKSPKEEIESRIDQLHQYEKKLDRLDKKLLDFAADLEQIEIAYDYLMIKKNRFLAANQLIQTDRLSVMEGYIPTDYCDTFKRLIEKELGEHFYLHIKQADEHDPKVPILLENVKFAKPFESVTEMYALPKYNEIDPTPWFSIFYAIFFGMMIGDAGYGLMMLLLSFSIIKVFNLTEKQRNFFQFFYYLSFTTILWGLIFGSFFGDLFSLPAVIDTNEQYNLLLTVSILLGAVHVFFALGIQAYIEIRRKRFLNALFDVGLWYMLLISSAFFLLSYFIEIIEAYRMVSMILLIISMIGIVLTGGREQKGFGKKLAGGLYSLYGFTGYISDFVSYSRLMALALASGFIAYAINLMVLMLFDFGIIGIIFGVLIFIVGQGFNIFLSILSSYVHTLSLTYVEFFGKFYEGGGRPFQMFRNATKYINIK